MRALRRGQRGAVEEAWAVREVPGETERPGAGTLAARIGEIGIRAPVKGCSGLVTLPLPLVLATGNTDKAREIVEILVERSDEPVVGWAVTVETQTFGYLLDRPDRIAATVARSPEVSEAPDVEETGATLEDNARIKASALADALGVPRSPTTPGSRSTRWRARRACTRLATPGRRRVIPTTSTSSLLPSGTGERPRPARFATVAMARWPDGRELAVRGEVEGAIAAGAAGERDSATTRCSCRSRATAARLRR